MMMSIEYRRTFLTQLSEILDIQQPWVKHVGHLNIGSELMPCITIYKRKTTQFLIVAYWKYPELIAQSPLGEASDVTYEWSDPALIEKIVIDVRKTIELFEQ